MSNIEIKNSGSGRILLKRSGQEHKYLKKGEKLEIDLSEGPVHLFKAQTVKKAKKKENK